MDKTKVIELYEEGLSQQDIGDLFGVSGQRISRILRDKGIETCRGGYKEKKSVIKEKHERVIDLYNVGISISHIAEIMDMTYSGIKYSLSRSNEVH